MATSPRPILKRSSHTRTSSTHAVHFPPSPTLTRTFSAHSPSAYDRSPITVSPNTCALPKRGHRTYYDEDMDVPPLIPDLSSESDESDTVLQVQIDVRRRRRRSKERDRDRACSKPLVEPNFMQFGMDDGCLGGF